MLKLAFAIVLLSSPLSFAKTGEKVFNRQPASTANVNVEVKKFVEAFLGETMKLEQNNSLECVVAKNNKFTCYKVETYSLCANGVREASNIEVRGSVEGTGDSRYIQASEVVYRLACYGKN